MNECLSLVSLNFLSLESLEIRYGHQNSKSIEYIRDEM